jgi:S-methylmethionine-dependent homocysteine/selenocysteine methylase
MPVDVSVMDGSVGRLIVNSGVPLCENLWSGRSITEEQYHPNVIDAHRQYIEAGCDMITTNNYTVQPHYYRKVFDDWEARIPKDAAVAARLACEARKLYGSSERPVRILGSLPPLCESHRPDLAREFIAKEGQAFIIKTYRDIAQGLLSGGPVDGFLAETMNTWEEAHCAIEAVKDLGKPLVVSMEGALRDDKMKPCPQHAAEIADKVMAAKADGVPIEALCFNCAPPEDIAAVVKVLDDGGYRARLHAAGIGLGAYANVQARKNVLDGEGFDAAKVDNTTVRVREDLANEGYINHLHGFIRCGVSYIGGCCGSTPQQIQMLIDSLQDVDCDDTRLARKRRRLVR